jgi:lysozyme
MANNVSSRLYKQLLALGLTGSLALTGAYLTAPSETPGGVPTLNTYLDTGNVPTSCYGHTGPEVKLGQRYTEDQCVKQFAADLKTHDKQLMSSVHRPFASEWEYGAMLDFTYNKGVGNLRSSSMLMYFNRGEHDKVCDELLKWKYGRNAKGEKVVINGLVNRATNEWLWCMGQVPKEVKELAK